MKLKHTHIYMKKDLHILSFFFQRVINIYDIHFLVDFIYDDNIDSVFLMFFFDRRKTGLYTSNTVQ